VSLQNLLKIGRLAEHKTDNNQVGKLLVAAERSIADARLDSISLHSRLDIAYRAVMQLSMIALWANGYRPSRSAPGRHQTMLQSLSPFYWAGSRSNVAAGYISRETQRD